MAALRIRLRIGVACVGLLSGVAGCANPNAAPTYTCTPETGGTPFPCYQAQYDQYQKQNKLYTEAETVYRKFVAEDERIYRAGGAKTATPVLKETTSGAAFDSAMEIYQDLYTTHTRMVGGSSWIAWIKRTPKEREPGSEVAMEACMNARAVSIVTPGEAGREVGSTTAAMQFARSDGVLKIVSVRGGWVESC